MERLTMNTVRSWYDLEQVSSRNLDRRNFGRGEADEV